MDKISRFMKRLPYRNQRKIKRGALRAGSREVVTALREEIDRIPETSLSRSGKQRYKKSIGTVTKRSRRSEAGVFIGPRYRGVKNVFPEAHLFEYGTSQRTTRAGHERGRIKPQPALRKGWDKSRNAAVERTTTELVDRTIDEAQKLLN